MNAPEPSWIKGFPGALTVCDTNGVILAMNEESVKVFAEDGGLDLIGKNLLDCHPEPSLSQLKQMMSTRSQNVYTIEKKGVKKLIFQSPWYDAGEYAGFIELSLEIPFDMPHSIRD